MRNLAKAGLIFGLVALYSFTNNEFDHTLKDFKLKEKVKSIRQFSICATPGKFCRNGEGFMRFNENGYLIEDSSFTNGKFDLLHTYKYSKNADTITQLWSDAKSNVFYSKTRYIYNKQGKLSDKLDFFKKDGKWRKTAQIIYTYNGQKGGALKPTKGDTAKILSLYTFDKNDHIEEETGYSNDGSLYYKTTYEYDDRNNAIKRVTWSRDSLPNGAIEYIAYAADNNIISIIDSFSDLHHFSAKTDYKYEYDQSGNWIKQESFTRDTLLYVKTRQIEYYK